MHQLMCHTWQTDLRVTDLLGPQICVQKRRIVPKGAKKTFFVRSHEQAWNDYTQHHVVSPHAARVIKNFLSTQLAEAAEAQVDDEGPQEREQWSAIDVSWMDRESVDNILQKGVSWKQKDSTSTKAVKFQAQLMDAIQRSCELWAPNTGSCELLPAGSKKSSAVASSTTPPLKRLSRCCGR